MSAATGEGVARPATAPSSGAVMAQAQDENFPVASRLLPARQRRPLLAIYGVARLIDDVGDEAAGDRGALLDWLDAELDRVFSGRAAEHPIMRTLASTLASCPLPEQPFRALVQANRQDQEVSRYETFEQLLGYCRLSADPVGELVLHVFGAATPERLALSARICSGLQVIEHIQDVAEDQARGRVYLPLQDMARFGCTEAEISHPHPGPALRAVLEFEAGRARELLDQGAPLARTLPGRARIAVAGFVAGGRASLDALDRASYDVGLGRPPRRSRRGFGRAFVKAVMGR